MAQLNTFKSLQYSFVGSDATDVGFGDPKEIYTAPAGYTAIVLNAQAANVKAGGGDVVVTLQLKKQTDSTPNVNTLVNQLAIPEKDAANLATGKLVLQPGDTLMGFVRPASSDPVVPGDGPNSLDLTLSFLETLNA